MMTKPLTEEAKQRQREASRRWKERNPDKVAEHNRRKRPHRYDPVVGKAWRDKAFADPEYRERINGLAQQRYAEVQDFLRAYKLEQGCMDCGYKGHHAALEFDHVRGGKRFNVCNAKSIRQAMAEIEKCEVVCANCHAIRTYERLQEDR